MLENIADFTIVQYSTEKYAVTVSHEFATQTLQRKGWGDDGSVTKVPAAQALGTEFKSTAPHKKTAIVLCYYNPGM